MGGTQYQVLERNVSRRRRKNQSSVPKHPVTTQRPDRRKREWAPKTTREKGRVRDASGRVQEGQPAHQRDKPEERLCLRNRESLLKEESM